MKPGVLRVALAVAAAACWSGPAFSQQESLEEIRVLGNRLDYALDDSPAPALIYGQDHFQSFEPQGVGDMLKRVAGVGFSGDIGEFDAPQLRGLDSRYTQVLINGERVPGNSADRTVLVDRIPAELIQRIELIRSPAPDIDSQGIGGTLNLVLKDGASLQGTDWRIGGLVYPDPHRDVQGSAAITHGFNSDTWNFVVTANVQERLNPKTKREQAFTEDEGLAQVIDANDLRDSTDKVLRGSLSTRLGNAGTLTFRLGLLNNHVEEQEHIEILDPDFQLIETALEEQGIEQQRTEFGIQFQRQLVSGANLQLSFSGGQFDDDSRDQEAVLEENIENPALRQLTATRGLELQAGGSLSWQLFVDHQVKVGVGVSREERESRQALLELEEDNLVDVTPGNGSYRVEETRAYAYIMDTWEIAEAITLEVGARLEDTGLRQQGTSGSARDTQLEINPSAHLLYRVGDAGQFRTSVARTLRRPVFDEIVPFMNRDTPDEDQVTVGNPQLQPEFAWGLDVGYAHRFAGNRDQLGMNFFYRRIEDRVELTRIDDDLFTSRNIGTGRAWGVELDFATSFAAFGLPQVGVFGNYVWIDSRIDDPFTNRTRQFNLQPDYIANFDLYHDLPLLQLSHGISWQKQGSGREFQFDEVKRVSYEANLEYFIEKRFLTDFTARLTINNILDAAKQERGLLYQGLTDLRNGVVDEFVIEREQTEPVFLLSIRGSF